MLDPLQMRAPSKRWLALASILLVSTVSLAVGFTRYRRAGNIEGAPASRQKSAFSNQRSARESTAVRSGSTLFDSDNDGIPDIVELRTFQDRDTFRRWFTAIAETQFHQLSDQWNAEQRDCAGLVRFAMRESLRHHDRVWLQKMGSAYQAVAGDVKGFDLDNNALGEKIFRTDFGSFNESDLRNGRFS